jgi:hypothetical protein
VPPEEGRGERTAQLALTGIAVAALLIVSVGVVSFFGLS